MTKGLKKQTKPPMTDAQRIARYEALLIDLYDAVEDTCNKSGAEAPSCDHERWAYFVQKHNTVLGHLMAAGIRSKIRRDKGKCYFCKGDAEKCYPRHSEGRSCA